MRGKVTDQDLTDYALNELSPDERLYVESMLAVSEECRGDVYQMLDLGEMLKEGFEMDETSADLMLVASQRERVLEVPRFHWRTFLQRAAAIALLSGGAIFTLTHQEWGKSAQLAGASKAVDNIFEEVRGNNFAHTAEEVTDRLMKVSTPAGSSEAADYQFVAAPAVCTPPIFDTGMPEIVEM